MGLNHISKTQGGTYCRPEKKDVPLKERTSGKYCPECRFHVRGKNHSKGTHHNSGGKK